MSQPIDVLFIVLSTMLVFMMQAGFMMLEAGFTRNKNSINVVMKNIADFALSALAFWLLGYGLMFGLSQAGLFGIDNFLPETNPASIQDIIFFLFQLMFCGTCVTIVAGAIVERARFSAYLWISVFVAALIYPVYGHWVWNGENLNQATGWLNSLGFVDFAGGSVVHSVGGWVALAMLIVIGPRLGRYDAKGKPQKIPASNLPLATVGVILLWLGWFGFNGGSALAFDEAAIRALINTTMAGSMGLVAAYIYSLILYRHVDVSLLLNGTLAGLVSITASAAVVGIGESLIIGAIAVLFMLGTEKLLDRFRIDDAIGAVSVHLGAGIWATLAVGLFGRLELLGTDLSRLEHIEIQLVGILACALWTFPASYLFGLFISKYFGLRVSEEEEVMGLNISEHNARSDLFDLFETMERQAQTGDMNIRVPVEPFTETGRIAERYNHLMDSLQQAIDRAEAIVYTVNDALVTFTSNDFRILSINPAAEKSFGYTNAQLEAKSFFVLLPSIPNLDAMAAFVDEMIATESMVELLALRSTGEKFLVELSMAYFEQGNSSFYTAAFRDISQRKQAEEQRQRLRELELKSSLALENSRLKSEFLSSVTHELRTPLNALIGYAGLLLMGVRGELDSDARTVVQSMEESGKHLLMLVNDVLDLDKIESGSFQFSNNPLDIRFFLKKWLEHTHILAQQKNLQLEANINPSFPPMILGDGDRLTQIALNLLSNAIKFTDKGRVELQVLSNGSSWQMMVSDTGIGMTEADKAIIFEKFRQVDGSNSRQYGGTGLGLSIVQQLVLAMGGSIEVESVPQEGSRFIVTLPLQAAT